MSILISKQTPFQLLDSMLDSGGRYIFLIGKIGSHPIMKQVAFFWKIKDLLTTSLLTQWEAHKCVIRGGFIANLARQKKERQSRIKSLIDQIHRPEITHKRTVVLSTLNKLTNARTTLSGELSMKTKRQYILRHKIYYEQGNKSRKLLA